MTHCFGVADFEVEALRHCTLEAALLLSYLTADSREEEDAVEAVGWIEGEDSEHQIRDASHGIPAVEEDPCITRYMRLTLGCSHGVSQKYLSSLICASFVYHERISQTNHCKTGGTLLVAGIEDHPQNLTETVPLEDVEDVAATPRNSRPHRHCRAFGMKSGRCCGLSSSSGPSSPPHFFKKPRTFLSLQSKTEASIYFP